MISVNTTPKRPSARHFAAHLKSRYPNTRSVDIHETHWHPPYELCTGRWAYMIRATLRYDTPDSYTSDFLFIVDHPSLVVDHTILSITEVG